MWCTRIGPLEQSQQYMYVHTCTCTFFYTCRCIIIKRDETVQLYTIHTCMYHQYSHSALSHMLQSCMYTCIIIQGAIRRRDALQLEEERSGLDRDRKRRHHDEVCTYCTASSFLQGEVKVQNLSVKIIILNIYSATKRRAYGVVQLKV